MEQKMDFTFGIITAGYSASGWRDIIMCMVDSIRRQNIPNYEIIIVGGPYIKDGRYSDILHTSKDITHIKFDETQFPGNIPVDEIPHRWGEQDKQSGVEPGWITRKKNLITESAKYENIVFLHDYICITEGWYQGFLQFGNDWDVCMNKIETIWGTRFTDWTTWDHPSLERRSQPSYDDSSISEYSYISGGYWVAKKRTMEKYPLDENILWGGVVYLPEENKFDLCENTEDKKYGDDVEWSLRMRKECKYVMNSHSKVKHIRVKLTGDEQFVGRTNCPIPINYR